MATKQKFGDGYLFVFGKMGIGKSSLITQLVNDFTARRTTAFFFSEPINRWLFRHSMGEIDLIVSEATEIDYRTRELISKNKCVIIIVVSLTGDEDYYLREIRKYTESTVIVLYYEDVKGIGYRTIDISFSKKQYRFIKYWLPITNRKRSDTVFGFGGGNIRTIKQIILNVFTDSLEQARYLIQANLEDRNPSLDIGRCGLTSLLDIRELFKCTHLETLIISNEWGERSTGRWVRRSSRNKGEDNILSDLPKEINRLQNLKTLIIGGNWNSHKFRKSSEWSISDISELGKLKQLRILNASNNRIQQLGDITTLTKLEDLHLNNNHIEKLSTFSKMKSLRRLYLSNNRITNIGFATKLINLKTLDVHSNLIENLTPIEALISSIGIEDSKWVENKISVRNNPLVVPTPEVVSQGTESVIAYLGQLKAEKEAKLPPFKNKDIKLVLVGNSTVGKSTLVKWLIENKVVKDIPSTHWMKIEEWQAQLSDLKFKVRIFDFGGQEYYHDSHYIFFTNRTAYLLLWDRTSTDFQYVSMEHPENKDQTVIVQNFPVKYWLDAIDYHSRQIKTSSELEIDDLIKTRNEELGDGGISDEDSDAIENKVGDHEPNILVSQSKVDQRRLKYFLDEKSLKELYPKISDFTSFSTFEQIGRENLISKLFQIFSSLEVIKQEYLGTWEVIKISLEKESFTKPLSIHEFQTYCNSKIKALPQLKSLTPAKTKKVLFSIQDTKVFAGFLRDIGISLYYPADEALKDKVFINRDQILVNIYKILGGLEDVNGQFSRSLAAEKIGVNENDTALNDILDLMRHFKMVFDHPAKKDVFIAPLYLPSEPGPDISIFLSLFGQPIVKYECKGFINKHIVLQFFSQYGKKALEMNKKLGLHYYWKDGIILKSDVNDELIMVSFNPGNSDYSYSTIAIFSISKNLRDPFLTQVLKDLETIGAGLELEKLVSNGSDFVPLKVIHRNESNGIGVFEHNGKKFKLSDFKPFLTGKLKMKKLFISYSKRDYQLVTDFIEHLSGLKRDGKISDWFCSKLMAGTEWDKEIQDHFDEADIVCFMISKNFMKTSYIHDYEIAKAFERKKTDPSLKIVPIILDYCKWTTSLNNLGIYTALPYTAKPIASFKNQNEGWYLVQACLEMMIDQDLNPIGDDYYGEDNLPTDIVNLYKKIVNGSAD